MYLDLINMIFFFNAFLYTYANMIVSTTISNLDKYLGLE